jgi:two-component system, chemotaxis family, chemotaxis protein CheY
LDELAFRAEVLLGAAVVQSKLMPVRGTLADIEVLLGPRDNRNLESTMSKSRALIVDDDASIRRALKAILTLRDFEVIEAGDGVMALELLKTNSVNVVFSDVSMPNMNGFELLGRIKRQPATATVPVVMLTSENRPEDIAKGQKLGCACYLIKPFNTAKLDEALTSAKLATSAHLGAK